MSINHLRILSRTLAGTTLTLHCVARRGRKTSLWESYEIILALSVCNNDFGRVWDRRECVQCHEYNTRYNIFLISTRLNIPTVPLCVYCMNHVKSPTNIIPLSWNRNSKQFTLEYKRRVHISDFMRDYYAFYLTPISCDTQSIISVLSKHSNYADYIQKNPIKRQWHTYKCPTCHVIQFGRICPRCAAIYRNMVDSYQLTSYLCFCELGVPDLSRIITRLYVCVKYSVPDIKK